MCVDGPEFDGHKVNFDLMIKRLNAYRPQEQQEHENIKLISAKLAPDRKNKKDFDCDGTRATGTFEAAFGKAEKRRT